MTPDQIPALLKQVSYADTRVLPTDPAELMGLAALWATVLTNVPADYALQAVGEHYANSPYPIKPSDIADRWRTTVRDRMRQHTGTFEPTAHPEVDPDDIPAYQQALRADLHAIATGQQQPTPARAISPTGVTESDVHAMRQQKDLTAFIKQSDKDAARECARRKALVNRYPDLVDRLHQIPGQKAWNGYIAPDSWNGQLNDSHIRAALIDLIHEAEQRAATGQNGQAA